MWGVTVEGWCQIRELRSDESGESGGAVGWCTMVGGGNDEGWGGLVGGLGSGSGRGWGRLAERGA